MASDWQRIEDAAARYGHTLDSVAQRYTNPVTGQPLSGQALILKTIKGESGGRRDATSSAGAKRWAQFMPGTRAAVVRQFGVDPWRSPEEAVQALTLHMRGKLGNAPGLEGYNPGGGEQYVSYILGQKVGPTRGGGLGASLARAGAGQGSAGAAGGGVQNFDPGDVSPLLAQIAQSRPAGPPVSAPTPPSFSAAPTLPKGYMEVPGSAPPAQPEDPLGAKLQAIAGMGQAPMFGEGSEGTGPTTGGQGGAFSGRSPTGKRGKIIGTPHAGTHTLGDWQSDNAVDIGVPAGTPMVSVANGVVVKVRHHPQGSGRFAGDQVTIRGANGNEYFYAHGVAGVKPGEKVRRGEVIGETGSANGVEHLHFSVRRGDPRRIIGQGR